MSLSRSSSLLRPFAFAAATALLAVGSANAQFTSADSTRMANVSTSESSSNDYMFTDSAEPAAPAPAPAGQYDNKGAGGSTRTGLMSRMAYEIGGGFNAPVGNDTPYITWGGNVTAGAGLHLNSRFAVLGEFQFLDNKLPGAFIAAGGGQTGNSHIIGLTLNPVIDFFPKWKNSAYVTVGGGYYHKSTNFDVQQCCDFYGYPVTVTANSFASNQGGVNGGIGFTHRMGGTYGESTTKLFAEVRYVYVNTPGINQNNGLGTTSLIPVTVGLRF